MKQSRRLQENWYDTLLIIDDDEINRGILANIFAPYCTADEAENGRDGLAMLEAAPERYFAVLLDICMPEMDGMEVLRRLNENGLISRVPVFIITTEADASMEEAYRLGVMDVISKPVVPFVVRRRIGSVVELFEARRQLEFRVAAQQNELLRRAQQIIDLNQGMVEALAAAIEFRSNESGQHVRRIHDITKLVFQRTMFGTGLPPRLIEDIALASVMHDVGKIAIPDAILNKPGRLTPEEFEVMKTHTTQGEALLGHIPQLRAHNAYRYAADIARHHHERWDGRGYPDGLKGDEISPWAQVVSLADVYDALRCKRVYKEALPRAQVVEMIRDGQCGTFNPALLDSFFAIEDEVAQLYHQEG